MKQHEIVNFNGQVSSDSYGYLSSGYDGFDWADMLAMGKYYVAENEPGTGFASALRGEGVGYTSTAGYGVFYTYTNAFSLRSGVFASAWESKQPVLFEAFSYKSGKGFHLKGAEVIYLSQTAKTISFAKFGHAFKNISLLLIQPYPGLAGSQGYYGYQVAMDNLKIDWSTSGAIHRHGARLAHPLPAISQHLTSHLHLAVAADQVHGTATSGEPGGTTAPHSGWHTELLSWDHDPGGGLTAAFKLPATEHIFGN